jgi:hypothetical protein
MISSAASPDSLLLLSLKYSFWFSLSCCQVELSFKTTGSRRSAIRTMDLAILLGPATSPLLPLLLSGDAGMALPSTRSEVTESKISMMGKDL